MITTSIKPPATTFVALHGNLLKQLGATKVEATDAFTIKATYTNNEKAVNADALLKDEIWGAKLVIDNQSMTADAPQVSVHGIADVLKGVQGLEVQAMVPRCPCPTEVTASSPDRELVSLVSDLINPKPTDMINVSVFHKAAAEPAG